MRTRLAVALVVAAFLFYAGLVGAKGVSLLAGGSAAGAALGVGLVVLPVLAALLVWREIRFGRATAAMAAVLDAEGGLPPDDLPRRPSGRVDRAAADEAFATRQAETEADPGNWRAWYRLALAYDDAGDRARARASARHAVALFTAERRP